MEYSKVTWAGTFALVVLSELAFADDIEFYTFPSPPYQIVDDTQGPDAPVSGLTVSTVLCAAQSTGMQSRVRAVPPRRAVEFLRNNLIDGYFAVDPSTSLDQIALRTDPVSLEKWYLVSRSDDGPPDMPRIGAVIGSNEEAWLRANGKDIFLTVRTSEQLIALLHRRRIDQALMDQRVLQSLTDTDGLTMEFLRYVPLHLYLSSAFSRTYPDFISGFNRTIPACINGSFTLDDAESAQIRGLAYDLFRQIENEVSLLSAIMEGPAIASLSEILNLDAQWQALAPAQYSEMARRIADLPASVSLSAWQDNHKSLVTEVMLTNSIGTLVAMSQLTSDFWQGDEPKFEHHIRTGDRNFYVSPIRYDASTARFQVTVSIPIMAKGRWIPAGVLAIGLDIEQALAGEKHILYLTHAIDH